MARKLFKQKYFVTKELRISIALIILWTLLVTAFFTYFTKELGERIGHGSLLFVVVMAGYIVIVVVLTLLFSHRLVGPFQRLRTEMRLIRAGDYQRRLNVRNNDDIYIRSFIIEVNELLEELDKTGLSRKDLIECIDSEMMGVIAVLESGEISKDTLRERVLSCHRKLKALAQK